MQLSNIVRDDAAVRTYLSPVIPRPGQLCHRVFTRTLCFAQRQRARPPSMLARLPDRGSRLHRRRYNADRCAKAIGEHARLFC